MWWRRWLERGEAVAQMDLGTSKDRSTTVIGDVTSRDWVGKGQRGARLRAEMDHPQLGFFPSLQFHIDPGSG
jgi:hypothetical protein